MGRAVGYATDHGICNILEKERSRWIFSTQELSFEASMEELRQAALQYIHSAELADPDELTSSINARH